MDGQPVARLSAARIVHISTVVSALGCVMLPRVVRFWSDHAALSDGCSEWGAPLGLAPGSLAYSFPTDDLEGMRCHTELLNLTFITRVTMLEGITPHG